MVTACRAERSSGRVLDLDGVLQSGHGLFRSCTPLDAYCSQQYHGTAPRGVSSATLIERAQPAVAAARNRSRLEVLMRLPGCSRLYAARRGAAPTRISRKAFQSGRMRSSAIRCRHKPPCWAQAAVQLNVFDQEMTECSERRFIPVRGHARSRGILSPARRPHNLISSSPA